MMLLEHDAKELLRVRGFPVPAAVLVREFDEADAAAPLPVVVKAQVPVGGRGKAGGIRFAHNAAERDDALCAILGMSIKGHRVRAVLLEEPVAFATEAYVSISIDPAIARVRILLSAQGGVDIEDEKTRDAILSDVADLDAETMKRVASALCARLTPFIARPLADALDRLIDAFLALEASVLEINPLFITPEGGWMIGDAKLVADDNAFERRAEIRTRVADQPLLYPEAALKIAQGYDFVHLDAEGDIGLVTTGAGLSMQLVDELVARGHSPYNFCDIRTGMFRGDPGRLIQVLRWIAQGRSVRVVLVNFFAGATDLAETVRLLLIAIAQVPELRVPIIARLIGNNLDAALNVIADAGNPIVAETDLDRAIEQAIAAMNDGMPA